MTGAGSQWNNSGYLFVGSAGSGSLTVSNSGSVGVVNGTEVGSNDGSTGVLRIESGGTLSNTYANIGDATGSTGTATVTGAGSKWTDIINLRVGRSGNGTLSVADDGTVDATSIYLGIDPGSTGTINVGAASGNPAAAPGTLAANNLAFGAGTGTLIFNHTSSNYLFAPAMSGVGNIKVENGRTVLTGDSSSFNGQTAIANGATLQVGNGGTNGAFGGSVANNGVLAFNRSDATTFAGAISGSGAVEQIGSGALTLTGSNTYAGDTTITGGTLQLGNGGTSGSIIGDVTNNGTLAFDRTDTATFAGAISGSGAVQQIGSGTTVLTGTNSYSGDTTVSSGILQFGNGSAGGSNNLGGKLDVTGGSLAIQTPATLNVAQGVTFADNTALSIVAKPSGPSLSGNSVTLGTNVAFNLGGINNSGQLDRVLIDTISGINGDFGTVTVGGFSGPVDYLTLATGKSANNLQYLATYGLSWTANNNLAHGTFTLTNPSDSFEVGAALSDQATNAATGWNGSALTKDGAGTLILTETNSYSGGTTITAGTVQLGNGGTSGSIVGDVTNNGTLAFNRSDATTFAGAISGSGAVQKIGPGTTVLTGTNTYSGGTELRGGILQVSADTNLGAASGGLTFLGGVLSSTASFDMSRSVVLTQAGRFDVATGATLGLTGVVSGSGDLVKQEAARCDSTMAPTPMVTRRLSPACWSATPARSPAPSAMPARWCSIRVATPASPAPSLG